MKPKHTALYAGAIAVIILGAFAIGVPTSTVWLLLVVLVCPVMMAVMMLTMKGHGGGSNHDQDLDKPSDSGRRP